LASVWKTHFDQGNPDEPFRVIAGPVIRMIVDLADMDHAWWIVDTGASGWPLSPHYADQHGLWKRVKYIPMVMNWEELRKNAVAVLTLTP
jgi:penicillin amidase